MRGVAPGLEVLKMREARERIKMIRQCYGIKRGDGRHINYIDAVGLQDGGCYRAYLIYNEADKDSFVELPHVVLITLEEDSIRDATPDEVKEILSPYRNTLYLD